MLIFLLVGYGLGDVFDCLGCFRLLDLYSLKITRDAFCDFFPKSKFAVF